MLSVFNFFAASADFPPPSPPLSPPAHHSMLSPFSDIPLSVWLLSFQKIWTNLNSITLFCFCFHIVSGSFLHFWLVENAVQHRLIKKSRTAKAKGTNSTECTVLSRVTQKTYIWTRKTTGRKKSIRTVNFETLRKKI